jgi:hypothetical protein
MIVDAVCPQLESLFMRMIILKSVVCVLGLSKRLVGGLIDQELKQIGGISHRHLLSSLHMMCDQCSSSFN